MSNEVTTEIKTIPYVVHVERIDGASADATRPADFLVEVPHGADEHAHYTQLRARLKGVLPDDLHEFFFVNTDVAAWAIGVATARAVVKKRPRTRALLVRSLIPRTFIDCNRPADFGGGSLAKGGLTAGIPAYVRDDDDRALLHDLHRQYVDTAGAAFREVCGGGGLALVPHTYGPRSLGITSVDDDIITQLRAACAPEMMSTWPMRAEIDLLTRDEHGVGYAPTGMEERLLKDFVDAGYETKCNDTYHLHSSSLAHVWSTTYPHQVMCFEARRDLVVEEYRPLDVTIPKSSAVERLANVLAPAFVDALNAPR